jgi:hypothetical protein
MINATPHTFHIPVLGLGYTIDTPLKVARYGISSVLSIVEDELIERMRKVHSNRSGEPYQPITADEEDYRARRITAYLDLVQKLVSRQVAYLRTLSFDEDSDLVKYFELLPPDAYLKKEYEKIMQMEAGEEKDLLLAYLRKQVVPGAIDVNIMCKVNKQNYSKAGELLPREYNDALAALRGFSRSSLQSAVVFSAGYNPDLYAYAEELGCFLPDATGRLTKRVILKVSDFRSALTQGKVMAKKGIWVSEFRIESGLNCGGHAFATEGLLLGPIMGEFRRNRLTMEQELLAMCNEALAKKGIAPFAASPGLRVSVQGGIGTANEHRFLLEHYGVDTAGWGSPFLLVPEATNVEEETLQQLAAAQKEDFYLSNASPLGVPFHNFRHSSSEKQRRQRLEKGRPGSPCYKEFLVSNTEFTERPVCTASRQYQHAKIREIGQKDLEPAAYAKELAAITDKDCLCEGLGSSALLVNGEAPSHKLTAVTICPGPNLAYFSGVFSLQQMVGHIYGKTSVLNAERRAHMFVNELQLYVRYFEGEWQKQAAAPAAKVARYLKTFHTNLLSGITYYKELVGCLQHEGAAYCREMKADLERIEQSLKEDYVFAV